MVRWKSGILSQLKDAGYNSTRIRTEKVIGQKTLSDLRNQCEVGNKTIDLLCSLLNCQPGDLLEYIPDDSEAK